MKFDISQASYISLRDILSERTQRIIAWIGSGLSAEANLPTWIGLKLGLLKAFENSARTLLPEDADKLMLSCKEIEKISDNWLAFQRLKALGDTTYKETIRELLRPAATTKIPKIYEFLWKLRIRGLINLNIDRIASRAYHLLTESTAIDFNGSQISSHLYVLKSPQQFILNLHGEYEDASSWVFTKSDLDRLRRSDAYDQFIRTSLISSVVLFLGISADDVAVGGHLDYLKSISSDFGTHYWITNRRDLTTDNWAESRGVRLIRYEAKDNDHSALEELFGDIFSYLPKDDTAPPVNPPKVPDEVANIEDPNKLLALDSESIRKILNKKAEEILKNSTQEEYAEYEKFFKKYDEVIYRAWYTSDEPDNNNLLGYKLEKYHAKGAFGDVYKATDENGNTVAVKVLLQEERKKKDFLQSFRRGVRSMRILSQHKVNGIVGYKEAAEIPAFVVMDWIDGPNLEKAVKSKLIDSWDLILKTACELAKIIENAHRLPERVLHRDLRPPNIMLQNYYPGSSSLKVVILDFDLSWHLGAIEKSMLPTGASSGYLAPEQIHEIANVSTRHATVDSYGLGMTLFFMISRRDPIPEESQHKSWEKELYNIAYNIQSEKWYSIPNRYARLILNSTRYKQAERWDVNQIRAELDRLYDSITDPNKVASAELIAEEVIARTGTSFNYDWNSDRLCATITLPKGAKICVLGDESKRRLCININWASRGGKRIFKWLDTRKNKIYSLLKNSKWDIEVCSTSGQSLNVTAYTKIDYAKENIDLISSNIYKIIDELKFE